MKYLFFKPIIFEKNERVKRISLDQMKYVAGKYFKLKQIGRTNNQLLDLAKAQVF